MADDLKAGTGEGENGAAAASANPPASGGEETAEQRIARLQAERDAATAEAQSAKKKYEDEHALNLSYKEKVELANRMQREGSGAPPTRPADPLDQEISDLEQTIRNLAANGQRDAVAESMYRRAVAEREQRDNMQRYQQALREAQSVFDSLSDRDLARRALELFATGNFRLPELAITAAKGERYDNAESERQRLEKIAKEREDDLKKRAASAPGIPPSAGGSLRPNLNAMPFSEYERVTKADPDGEGKRLRKQRDEGKLVLNMQA